jgi:hypothetical protein
MQPILLAAPPTALAASFVINQWRHEQRSSSKDHIFIVILSLSEYHVKSRPVVRPPDYLLLQRLSAPVPAMTVLDSLARPDYTSLRGSRIPRREALPRERVCRNSICNSLCMRLESIQC